MKAMRAALACCLFALAATGCTSSNVGDIRWELPRCDPEKQLVLYTDQPDRVYLPIVQEFEDRTGIWVQVQTGGSQELIARIAAQAGKPEADLMFGGGVDSMQAYEDCFAAYGSSQTDSLANGYVDTAGRWAGFLVQPIVLIYNTKLVSTRDAPTRWSDLVDGKWAGRIAFANPGASGFCYTAMMTAIQLYGEPYLNAFIKNLNGRCLDTTEQIVADVSKGNFAVGIAPESSACQAVVEGADLAYIYPKDGTSAIPEGVAVVKDAPHAKNARLFMDFVLGHDAQEYLANDLGCRPTRCGIYINSLPRLEDVQLIRYDMKKAASYQKRMLELWVASIPSAGEARS